MRKLIFAKIAHLKMCTIGLINKSKVKYFAKKELFIFPFSLFLKWTGAILVNRQKNESLVDRSALLFKTMKELFRRK